MVLLDILRIFLDHPRHKPVWLTVLHSVHTDLCMATGDIPGIRDWYMRQNKNELQGVIFAKISSYMFYQPAPPVCIWSPVHKCPEILPATLAQSVSEPGGMSTDRRVMFTSMLEGNMKPFRHTEFGNTKEKHVRTVIMVISCYSCIIF